jgi:hypothetical protein
MMLAVTGSREGMTDEQHAALSHLISIWGITRLVHGDCRGVDAEADEVAQRCGVLRFGYPSHLHSTRAHTERWGTVMLAAPAHPLTRNRWIVELGDVVAAFPRPSSRGTWHAVGIARELKRPLVVVMEDGLPYLAKR